jgi:hypothetical protein
MTASQVMRHQNQLLTQVNMSINTANNTCSQQGGNHQFSKNNVTLCHSSNEFRQGLNNPPAPPQSLGLDPTQQQLFGYSPPPSQPQNNPLGFHLEESKRPSGVTMQMQ